MLLFHVCSLFRCETTSAAVPPLRGRKIGIIASEMKLPALQSKFRILNFKSALRHYIIIIYIPQGTKGYGALIGEEDGSCACCFQTRTWTTNKRTVYGFI